MYVRNRIPVWYSVAIESMVVPTQSPVTRCFLRHHMERGSPWAGRGADNTQLQHVVEFPFSDLESVMCQMSRSG